MAQRTEPRSFCDQIIYAAECILEAGRDTLEHCGREYPERHYVTVGVPAVDCQQFTVSLIQAYTGTPGDQSGMPTACDGPASAIFNVQLVRCIPTPNLKQRETVSIEAETDSARGLFTDASALLRLSNFLPFDFDRSTISDVTVGEPQGGFVGINLNIVVGLN